MRGEVRVYYEGVPSVDRRSLIRGLQMRLQAPVYIYCDLDLRGVRALSALMNM